MAIAIESDKDLARQITSISELSQYLDLSSVEIHEMEKVASRYPFKVSRYTTSLMDQSDENCPIRRQFLPDIRELSDSQGQPDPLSEVAHLAVKRVIKVYPDRVAVIVSGNCASLCRFCFRKNMLKNSSDNMMVTEAEREEALEFIASDKNIRDVLVTGGDPLMLPDVTLDRFLKKLRAIQHVQIIRLGTRMLTTWPQRITQSFAAMLAKYHPLWLNLHFNHHQELTPQAAAAADNLNFEGIPLSNQTVLLKGINDNVEVMKTLSRKLLVMRIRPYYLFQCHLVEGTAHLRTTIEAGQKIIADMRGRITGLGIPLYILDTPYGKVPINPNYLIGREGEKIRVRTYDNHYWEEYNL